MRYSIVSTTSSKSLFRQDYNNNPEFVDDIAFLAVQI